MEGTWDSAMALPLLPWPQIFECMLCARHVCLLLQGGHRQDSPAPIECAVRQLFAQ